MEYGKLGTTGLDISKICLGVMSFGDASRGGHPWVLGPDAARPLIRQAVEAGITFFDTANVYSGGSSEEILGAALKEYTDRDDDRAGDQGSWRDAARPEWPRPLA